METAVAESLYNISQENCARVSLFCRIKCGINALSFVLKHHHIQEKAQQIGRKYEARDCQQCLASPQQTLPTGPSRCRRHHLRLCRRIICVVAQDGCKFKPANCQDGIYLGTHTSLTKENNIFSSSFFSKQTPALWPPSLPCLGDINQVWAAPARQHQSRVLHSSYSVAGPNKSWNILPHTSESTRKTPSLLNI